MKSTWSVRTGPYLVVTVVPSTMGRMSRWTPSRETSGPVAALAARDLVHLVDEDDARVLRALHGQARHLLGVHEPRLLLLQQHLAGFGHGQAAPPRAAAEQAGQACPSG